MSGTNEFKRVTAFVLATVLAVCGIMISDARSAYAGAKKPGKPIAKASLYSGNKIIVKWKKVKNAKSYQIYRKIASGKWKKIKTIKAGKKKSFRYEAYAKANRRYYYKVRGVNDTDADAKALAALVRGMRCHINLIPVNPVKERNYRAPDRRAVLAFQNKLEKSGINVTIRREMGTDIGGACGQLRKSYLEGSRQE